MADWPRLPASDFWVMLSYVAAQYLLTEGTLRSMYGERRTTL
ncbi:hypothetical protein [Streptomyces sp. NPDC058084]